VPPRLRVQMGSIESIFPYWSCISSFLKRSPCDRITEYARDGRIGRTRLAGPAGRRATLSNLRSIFHSRNSFAIQFSDMCTTCCVEPASVAGDQIGFEILFRSNAFLLFLLVLCNNWRVDMTQYINKQKDRDWNKK